MTSKPKSLNDEAWIKLFDKYSILENINSYGMYEISAKEINVFREARLMTKFDHKNNLPDLFKRSGLSILPITRGSYVISNFEAYHKFEDSKGSIHADVHKVVTPDYIQSIDFENITSEATALNVAYLSGILADFVKEEQLYPTVNGRMSSEEFRFEIRNNLLDCSQSISVLNSQIEIDAGYEGLDSLTLIEAKNSLSEDFLIRQLYYPYRKWHDKVEKSVRSIFLTYTNGLFSLYEYEFFEPGHYNSIRLVQQKKYTLEQDDIQIEEIINIFDKVVVMSEPVGIPFPQANSFSRVVNICELLNENSILTPEEITLKYDFDARQTNYYTDACRYLGLIEKNTEESGRINYSLTERGRSIFRLSLKKRNLFFVGIILEKRAFKNSFNEYLLGLELPSKEKIVNIMKSSNLYNIRSESTFNRRASTVSGWLNWILDLTR